MRKEHNGNKCVVLHIWLPLHKILNINRKQGRIKNAIKLCVGFHLETLNDSSLRCQVTSRVFSSTSSSSIWAAPPHRPQPIIAPHMRPKKSKLWWIAYSSTKISQMASTMLTPRMIEAYILILWKDIYRVLFNCSSQFLIPKWKTWAVNQRFCSMKFSMYKRSSLVEQRFSL